jgi:hypothetical protein
MVKEVKEMRMKISVMGSAARFRTQVWMKTQDILAV